jgi:hypothetical protein
MGPSKTYRVLLLVLLPVIVLLIYLEGQHYDPALIRFESSKPERDSITRFFPNEITGFIRTGRIRSFTRENLYEYVNGHAEYFISSGFVSLAVGEYGKAGSEDSEPDVLVDIYDMGKSIHAFGVLSDESGGKVIDLQDGLMGFRTPLGISFVKGQYYVKVSTYNEKISLYTFSESINSKIDAESDPFPEFARLPDIGDVVSTRFVKEAYRGLDFLNNVIEREYVFNGEPVQIFVISEEKKAIKRLVGLFFEYFRESDIQFNVIEKKGKVVYRVKDPYEGDWVLVSFPDTLFGIYGSFDDTIINTLLAES